MCSLVNSATGKILFSSFNLNCYTLSVESLNWECDLVCSFIDESEEQERLELRSRTEVRMTDGEPQESIIYQFAGKTAQE